MDNNPTAATPQWSGIPLDITADPVAPAPQPVQPQSDLPPAPPPPPPPPAPPVPAKMKEAGGAIVAESSDQIAKEEGDEYWESYAREIELEKEIAEIGGVEKVASGEVKVPEEIEKEMGVKPAVTIETPIAKVVDFTIHGVALTDEQLGNGLVRPTSSGFRWLVEWFIYQLLKAHYLVKKVKGKVLRYKSK